MPTTVCSAPAGYVSAPCLLRGSDEFVAFSCGTRRHSLTRLRLPSRRWGRSAVLALCLEAPAYSVVSDADEDGSALGLLRIGYGRGDIVQNSGESAEIQDTPWMCSVCHNTGFIPCRKCGASGVLRTGKSVNVFFCQDCTGKKKLPCPEPPEGCGGKCYMCE
jgi:hypothetical protein